MLSAARVMLAGITDQTKTTTVTIVRATTVTSPVGGTTLDWTTPVTVTTTTGRAQPASRDFLERAGLATLGDAVVWYLADANVIPVTHRLLADSTYYRVVSVERWDGAHTRVITEVIADEEAASG